MTVLKSLLLSLCMVVTYAAHSAEQPTSLSKKVGGGAFSFDVPRTWVIVNTEGQRSLNASDRLFDLVPADSTLQSKLVVVYYPNRVPITAQTHWEAFTPDGNVELPRVDTQPGWILVGRAGTIRTAYYQIGGGTLVIDLGQRDYEQSVQAFLVVVRSFRDLGNNN